ncbi:50S ribosomal protein L23 [Paenibacillus sp. 598K]|uniref:50S ribosomal protein L23 n=1 Tax=Paenibacillus sp. 598K TaxID=1117987 RepID=UPI000FFA6964|nr:50S ribosomal protein L23 [Paenibacillus sp. 598K]GBF77035.1 50S ribosomal protein L23 [Paenibacillus sp. 598K]
MKNAHDIIKRPIITERTSELMVAKRYVFEVDMRANKTAIKQAIESIFGVKVASVNTMRVPGKPKRQGRHAGYTSEWKKAIVQLTEESNELEFFEASV